MKRLDNNALENLKELSANTGRNLVVQLANLYIDSTPEDIKNIQVSIEGKNYNEAARLAHSLKSSSSNLGALSIAEICRKIEHGIIKGELQHDELQTLTQVLTKEYELTLDELVELKQV